jgi:hypothetical protein
MVGPPFGQSKQPIPLFFIFKCTNTSRRRCRFRVGVQNDKTKGVAEEEVDRKQKRQRLFCASRQKNNGQNDRRCWRLIRRHSRIQPIIRQSERSHETRYELSAREARRLERWVAPIGGALRGLGCFSFFPLASTIGRKRNKRL